MSIKSAAKVRQTGYPLLMEYNLCGDCYVVLMSGPGVGTVVKSNDPNNPVGCHRTDWIMVVGNQVFFKPYPHVIEMVNSD